MLPRRRQFAASAVCLLLVAAGCGRPKPAVIVGAKTGTEQTIVAEILAQHLTRQLPDVRIVRGFGLLGTQAAHQALLAGQISVYPESSGAALVSVLGLDPRGTREEIREQVRFNYRSRFHCEWFGPLGFDSPFALVIAKKLADAEKIRTISDAANYSRGWSLSVSREFQERADGIALMMRQYRIKQNSALRILDYGQIYPALRQGQATMVASIATDADLAEGDLIALEDDKKAFPPCEVGFVIRTATLQETPELAPALRQLTGKFTAAAVQKMNVRVERDKTPAEVIAADFLKGAGI